MKKERTEICEICNKYVGFSYDIHKILQHPPEHRIEEPAQPPKRKKRNAQ